MKTIFTYTITDADIRYNVDTAATEMEEENQVQFPDADARAEFIDDCIACIADKYELYEHDPFTYTPDYEMEVLDLAKLYGYLL